MLSTMLRITILFLGMTSAVALPDAAYGCEEKMEQDSPDAPEQNHAEDGCTAIAHSCGCCFSGFYFSNSVQIKEPPLAKWQHDDGFFGTNAIFSCSYVATVFRPPIG